MMKLFINIGLIIIISACNTNVEKPLSSDSYSIIVNYSDHKNWSADSLESIIPDTILVVEDDRVIFGLFTNFRQASDRGFQLYVDKIIPNFDVIIGDSIIPNDYTPFYFVGWHLDRPALYRTDLLDVSPKLVWSKWGREILQLYRDHERNHYFFTTVLHEGIRGNFPLKMDARLYYFNRLDENAKLIHQAGNVMSIDGRWDTDLTFINYISVLDSMLTSNIIQYQFDYSKDGKQINSTERIFELIEGIPIPKLSNINPVSPNLRYKLSVIKSDSLIQLNIIDELNGTNNFITNLSGEIKENIWNTVGDYLFVTCDAESDSTTLYSINLQKMNIASEIKAVGEMNLLIIGNLLIYDEDFDNEAKIILFRYRKDDIFSSIKVNGGCGINSIPERNKIF